MRIAGINSPNYQVKDYQNKDRLSKESRTQSSESSQIPERIAVPVPIPAVYEKKHSKSDLPNSRQSPSQIDKIPGQDLISSHYLPSVTQAQHRDAQHNGELMQPSAKESNNDISSSYDNRVHFFTQLNGAAEQGGAWNTYTSAGPSSAGQRQTAGIVPDNTSHKARAAISEYLQTQFIEERLHFKEVLGVDEYA